MTNTLYMDLLSHGEAMGGDILRGSTDNVLSVKGWQQMHQVLSGIDEKNWNGIVSSPLRRCADFAQHISRKYEIPLWIVSEMSEISYGDWEGMGVPHLQIMYGNTFNDYQSDPVAVTPPNGESLMAYKKRIIEQWDNIVQRYVSGKVLLICHNSTIQILLSHMISLSLAEVNDISLPPAYFSRIEIIKNGQNVIEKFIVQGDNMLQF